MQPSEQGDLRAPQLYRRTWFPVDVFLEDAPDSARYYIADRNKIEIPPQFYRTTVRLWMGYEEQPAEVWFLHPATGQFEPVSSLEPFVENGRTFYRMYFARPVWSMNPFTFDDPARLPIYVVWAHQPESHH